MKDIKIVLDYMTKVNAFNLFLHKGLNAVQSTFPEYVSFVKENEGKTLREVKKENKPL